MSNEGVAANGLWAGAVISAALDVCFAVGFDFDVILRIRKRNTNRERLALCCAVKNCAQTELRRGQLQTKTLQGVAPEGT